jgi:two-component system CheB/CheR fusion protein
MTAERTPQGGDTKESLRERARQRMESVKADVSQLDRQDIQALIEELEIHQAELAIQNEELQVSEAALRTARDRYRDLFERAPIGYLIVDGQGRIREANTRAGELLGTGADAVVGHDLTEYLDSGSQNTYHFHRRALKRGAEYRIDELTLRPWDGGSRVVRMETVLEPGEDAEESTFRCALMDITERVRAEQALAQERDQLEERVAERTAEIDRLRGHREQLLNSLGEGLIGLDAEGRFTFLNPYALEVLGATSQDDLLGQASQAWLYPDPTPGECPIQQVLAGGETQGPWEDRWRRTDGGELAVEVFASPVTEDGSPNGAVVLFTGLGERRSVLDRLSDRERQVLDLLGQGLTNKEAAQRLGISHRTVEVHRARLMEKLEVSSFADLIRLIHS